MLRILAEIWIGVVQANRRAKLLGESRFDIDIRRSKWGGRLVRIRLVQIWEIHLKTLRAFPALLAVAAIYLAGPICAAANLEVVEIPKGQAPLGMVEIQGVGAGPFDPVEWQNDQLNWVPDVRAPLLAPRMAGAFRNIYAPSAVTEGTGWLFFYSAWDGTESGNDRVYMSRTADFIDFYDRHTIIHNGQFVHVSNVNAQRLDQNSLELFATAWPDPERANKPVYFFSKDNGKTWNGSPTPYHAELKDIVQVDGYAGYKKGDLNGANVLLREGHKYRLYFTNWHDGGKLYWAEGKAPTAFAFGGVSLNTFHAVNDVKKFQANGREWYLMALHKKGDVGLTIKGADQLWFSLSNDGRTFGTEHKMVRSRGDDDRYIFAVGFITRSDRVLGVLYGAGPTVLCNRNQIFGYWLQKRVVLVAKPGYSEGNGAEYQAQGALGPDRQWIKLPLDQPFQGTLNFYGEDGVTLIGTVPVNLKPGCVYQLKLTDASQHRPTAPSR